MFPMLHKEVQNPCLDGRRDGGCFSRLAYALVCLQNPAVNRFFHLIVDGYAIVVIVSVGVHHFVFFYTGSITHVLLTQLVAYEQAAALESDALRAFCPIGAPKPR